MEAEVIILAAGKGTRMKSDLPKALHEVCGKPLLWHSVSIARAVTKSVPIVVVGHREELVRKAFAGEKIRWVRQREQLGTAHAVLTARKALSSLKRPLVIINADQPLLPPEALQEMVKALKKKKVPCIVMTAELRERSGYGRVIRAQNGSIKKIIEERDASPREKMIEEVNGGAYVFDAKELFRALKKVNRNNVQREFYLTGAIAVFVRQGKKVLAHKVKCEESIYSVTTRWDIPKVSVILMGRKMKRLAQNGVTILSPEDTWIEMDVEIVKDSVIYPFTVIENGVRIGRSCVVGPFAHLRKGTALSDHSEVGNFVECKKTLMGAHSKAKHLSYLGDAVIGKKVNIGAGTICANYDGIRKHTTQIENGASVGSGTIFVAPVRMGKNAKTGAGAVVARGKNIPNGETHVGIPARRLKNKPRTSRRTAGG
jgi:bifunctional UDP-N-acetylglucosamine pyrophosphorylase/glucosamine-1-phosphate N-acetyltransferase